MKKTLYEFDPGTLWTGFRYGVVPAVSNGLNSAANTVKVAAKNAKRNKKSLYKNIVKQLSKSAKKDPTLFGDAVRTAELFKRFGMSIIEADGLDNATAKYYDNTGTLRTVDLTNVDLIVGSAEAFSVIDNVDMARIIDSELFNGSKAQVEINTGFTVTNPNAIVVKAHTGSV